MKVLLDTSFILPTLGIHVNKEVLDGLALIKNKDLEAFVSRFSLLEALWLSARLIKEGKFDEKRFSIGLESIYGKGRYRFVNESKEVFQKALELYRMGHHDIIDNILYALSLENNFLLLTLDKELREFINKNNLEKTTVTPKELKKIT